MALRAFYTKKDDIPEDLAELYVEKEGKWLLDVEAVEGLGLADVGKLKSALQTERERANKAETSLKRFDGIEDPAAAASALKKLKELGDIDAIEDLSEKHKQQVELAKAQAKEAFDRERLKLEEKYNTDLTSVRQELENTGGQLRKEMVRNAALRAIEKHGGGKSINLLLPFIESRTKVEKGDDGQMVMKVLDEKGQPLTTAALGSVADMGLEEFVGMLKQSKDYAHVFEGSQASGSGAGSGSGSGGGSGATGGNPNTVTIKRAEMRTPEGFQKYQAARAAQEAGNGPAVQVVD